MTTLQLPDFLPEEVKQRMQADKAYILKFQELSQTNPNWATMSQAERSQLARSLV